MSALDSSGLFLSSEEARYSLFATKLNDLRSATFSHEKPALVYLDKSVLSTAIFLLEEIGWGNVLK